MPINHLHPWVSLFILYLFRRVFLYYEKSEFHVKHSSANQQPGIASPDSSSPIWLWISFSCESFLLCPNSLFAVLSLLFWLTISFLFLCGFIKARLFPLLPLLFFTLPLFPISAPPPVSAEKKGPSHLTLHNASRQYDRSQ